MKKGIALAILFAFLLSACSGAQATETAATVGQTEAALPLTGTEAVTQAAVEPTAAATSVTGAETPEMPAATASPTVGAEAESSPTAVGAPAGGETVFRIIPEESKVTYEVAETFLENNRIGTAIGVTQGIEGEISIDQANPQNSRLGTVTVDISQFKSDSNRRDNAIRGRYLESAQFPNVVFEPTSIEGLPSTLEEGVEIPLMINGNLTIREVTRPATFDVVVRLEGDRITGNATTTILMSDFGFGPISIAGMLNTEDEVKVTFEFVAAPQS